MAWASAARRAIGAQAEEAAVVEAVDVCAGVVCPSTGVVCRTAPECVVAYDTDGTASPQCIQKALAATGDSCDDGDPTTISTTCTASGACIGPTLPCIVGDWVDSQVCLVPDFSEDATSVRTRSITQHPQFGGAGCPNLSEETPCPAQDCELSAFSAWSECDGSYPWTQSRSRTVLQPAARGGFCPSGLSETRDCPAPDCSAFTATPEVCRIWCDAPEANQCCCTLPGSPTTSPTSSPTIAPTDAPTALPTALPTSLPTSSAGQCSTVVADGECFRRRGKRRRAAASSATSNQTQKAAP